MPDSEPRPERLLPIGEAAHLAGVSVETMRRYEREGKIKPLRTAGGQRRFRRSEVQALLEGSAA